MLSDALRNFFQCCWIVCHCHPGPWISFLFGTVSHTFRAAAVITAVKFLITVAPHSSAPLWGLCVNSDHRFHICLILSVSNAFRFLQLWTLSFCAKHINKSVMVKRAACRPACWPPGGLQDGPPVREWSSAPVKFRKSSEVCWFSRINWLQEVSDGNQACVFPAGRSSHQELDGLSPTTRPPCYRNLSLEG